MPGNKRRKAAFRGIGEDRGERVPNLPPPSDVAAILCADFHLSEKPPVARSAETDWYAAMGRQCVELNALADRYMCPVVGAGDIFDRWNPRPELINFALRYLPPRMYCVPGQHDLPHHNYEDKHRSAYWTLVKAGKIEDLLPGIPVDVGEGAKAVRLHGFPWGFPVEMIETSSVVLEVAVVHAYFWTRGKGYVGAPADKLPSEWAKRLKGYDLAVFGDNHTPSYVPAGNLGVGMYGCGGFFRRRADEKNHRPSVGLLHTDGSVTRHYLDVSQDKFLDEPQEELTVGCGFDDFVASLSDLTNSAIDFSEAVKRALEGGVSDAVRRLILQAMEAKSL